MDEKNKKKAAAAAIVGALGLILLLRKKGPTAPPPPPPDKANLYGHVTDAVTKQAIEGIQVSFASYLTITDPNGYYAIQNIEPGSYDVTFLDPTGYYQTAIL
jgi:hypothetical protein